MKQNEYTDKFFRTAHPTLWNKLGCLFSTCSSSNVFNVVRFPQGFHRKIKFLQLGFTLETLCRSWKQKAWASNGSNGTSTTCFCCCTCRLLGLKFTSSLWSYLCWGSVGSSAVILLASLIVFLEADPCLFPVMDGTFQLISLSSQMSMDPANSLSAHTLPELLLYSFILQFVLSDICDTYRKNKQVNTHWDFLMSPVKQTLFTLARKRNLQKAK